MDCATTDEDVDKYVVPALGRMGYGISDIKILVLTHKHKDHMGGLERVLALAPNIRVITKEEPLYGGICIYPMAGHTDDCIGVFDRRSNTLISEDGLQGYGVDKFPRSVKSCTAYLETAERIRSDGRIENILFSHAYEPWRTDRIVGRPAVEDCLSVCTEFMNGEKK